MKTKQRNRKSKLLCRSFAAAALGGGLLLTAGSAPAHAHAQNLGEAIGNAIQQGGAEANNGTNVSGQAATGLSGDQGATQRGIDRAIGGALQGDSPRDAIRGGLNEAAQSAVENPQQTQQRDQLRANGQLQGQANQNGLQGNLNGNVQNQTWQRDAQGRSFYRNNQGQIIYGNGPQTGQAYPNQNYQNQNYQNQNQPQASFGNSLGANFQAGQQGIMVSSVATGSPASIAGLQNGDVVVDLDDQPIRDVNTLNRRLEELGVNQQSQMTVRRNGQNQIVRFTGTSHANHSSHTSSAAASQNRELSAKIDRMQTELSDLRREVKSMQAQMKSQTSMKSGSDSASSDAQEKADAKEELDLQTVHPFENK